MLRKGTKSPIVRDMGRFVTRLNMPGWLLPWPNDHGYGPLAMIVESMLEPGRLIAMHEHRNDEIVSWVPQGVMRHDDRANGPLVTDDAHLMVMNAGKSFWHSEETLAGDPPLRMLQIFVRPHSVDLEPMIQFGAIEAAPRNQWRHLFGPEGGPAPFHVRNSVDFFDIRLDAGARVSFPPMTGRDLYFYVFSGSIETGGEVFDEREQGLFVLPETLILTAIKPSIMVAFLIDPSAAITKQGTVGDHPKIPSAFLARPLMRMLRWRNRWRGT